ncbi:Gfo/Idh/MocA family oxidoreductase [Ruficoccus amylovorans]|uniref:Gfo/Idh/MocA family oxidoreductase n=1 Tax=Ruficoccus amylovorans TaxID=1804625 RepID=A0A842HC84_9BACT|nr:Gfo/Idh/MocA family oxidoreductase [Ruficoccus amylovorans]MBC2594095.1 Gfo/Idh/MocA family oxidoreductase [Ruficoccus amylovorans]
MTQSLRIGFIGAGGNTRSMHIPGFQAIEGVELAVVCNRSAASSQKVAKEFGIARTAADWRDVVADPEVDAICIGTWPYMHAEVTVAALEAGKHVLTEARMACDLEEATAMFRAAHKHPELVAQIVPAPFSFKYDATVTDLLGSGELGSLREIRVAHLTAGASDPAAAITWRQDGELSGKNIMTMGIHYETVQRWLGGLDPVWVQATGAIYTSERLNVETGQLQTVDIPDTLNVVAGYAEGFQLVMTFSSVATGANYWGMRLDGDRASLRYDLSTQSLFRSRVGQGGEETSPVAPLNEGKWQVEADFVASIREGAPVTRTSFADGLRYMRFTERVWESWTNEGRRVAW